jgi:hypothetical protein
MPACRLSAWPSISPHAGSSSLAWPRSSPAVLEEVGLRPEQLELELKEAALIRDFAASVATLAELKELGTRLALDDFGNGGASAIGYLRRLPIDVIKLDRTLIKEAGHPGTEQIIALAVTELAHSLAIKVVAQGVETQAQLSFLQEAGCDTIQGYLISPPLDAAGMTAWLDAASPANTARAPIQKKAPVQNRATSESERCSTDMPLGGPGSTGSSNEVAASPYICLTSFHAGQLASIAALQAMVPALSKSKLARARVCAGHRPWGEGYA